ncbi:hypothetical protein [Polaromonas sp. CG9_12]|nr:hypothetical protein [Polaromonas sp. CG9_12]
MYTNGALTIIPTTAAITALGGPALVGAYDSALTDVSAAPEVQRVDDNGNNRNKVNSQENGKTATQWGSHKATLVNCGVSMPAGVNTTTCQ